MWVFDGNENVSPINIQDEMMIGISYNRLIDACIANATFGKGKKRDPGYTLESALRETLEEYIEMVIKNTKEEFELCLPKMAKEMERRIENV